MKNIFILLLLSFSILFFGCIQTGNTSELKKVDQTSIQNNSSANLNLINKSNMCIGQKANAWCRQDKLVDFICANGMWEAIEQNCEFGCEGGICLTKARTCSDGTEGNSCSTNKPKYCNSDFLLIDNISCGCKTGFEVDKGSCMPSINTNFIISQGKKSAKIKVMNVTEVSENPNPFYEDKPNIKWIMFDLYIENVGAEPFGTLALSMKDEKDREFNVYSCSFDTIPSDSYAIEKGCYGEVSSLSKDYYLVVEGWLFDQLANPIRIKVQ